MKLTVIRHKATPYATYGRMFAQDGHQLCVTIERPWVDADHNGQRDRGVSRFVPGVYQCFLRRSHKNGGTGKRDYDVWELKNVPDCDHAQIHRANLPTDLEGCIGVGTAFGDVEGKPGITGSKLAFEKLMKETAGLEALELEVVGP